MYLSKKKIILVISISIVVFFFTYTVVKSQDVKIIDGDTIRINGEKIRFSGIDAPELKQTCSIDGIKNLCGIIAKKILIDKPEIKETNAIRDELVSFHDCVIEKKETPVTIDDGIGAMELAYRILDEMSKVYLK